MSGRREIKVASRPVLSHAADAVQAGDHVFVAGILPVDASGALVGGEDVVAQAERVFADLGEILAAAGCSHGDVAKLTLYLTDIGDRAAINPVWRRFFGDARPASTLVEVTGLAVAGAKLEVDCVAVTS